MNKVRQAKSIIISRKPGKDEDSMMSAFIGFFDENNPHLKGRAPFHVMDVPNIEKVRIRDLLNVSYYLLGNDIVINNLEEVIISKDENNIITITGKQELAQ